MAIDGCAEMRKNFHFSESKNVAKINGKKQPVSYL